MASDEAHAYEIMRELDVDYVLVIFGGLISYSSDGKQIGLLESKKVYLVITSGGTRIDSKDDFLTPWLKHVLNFFGIKNIKVISADQMSIDYEGSIKKAEEEINKIT